MKKIAIVLAIVTLVVLDLMLSGMNVVAGLLILAGVGGGCALIDCIGSESKRTTSITHAARQQHQNRITSQRGSSCVRRSLDGWQHCSQEMQYAK